MIDIMSDHKIIKDLFEDHPGKPQQGNQKNFSEKNQDQKDSLGFQKPPEKKGSSEGIQKDEKQEPKPVYKQKPKKMMSSKNTGFQDLALLQSMGLIDLMIIYIFFFNKFQFFPLKIGSESNVEKLHFEGNVKTKIDFF